MLSKIKFVISMCTVLLLLYSCKVGNSISMDTKPAKTSNDLTIQNTEAEKTAGIRKGNQTDKSSSIRKIYTDESMSFVWVDNNLHSISDNILVFFQKYLKDQYKINKVNLNNFKKINIPQTSISKLQLKIPKDNIIHWMIFSDENQILYEVYKEKNSILAYDIETSKITPVKYSFDYETKAERLSNGNIVIFDFVKLIVLDKQTLKVLKEVKYPSGLSCYPSLSKDGNKIAYIRNDGLFISDLDFKNTKFLFPYELHIGQNQGVYNLESVKWTAGDKIVFNYGAVETPLGVGFMNIDGSDRVNLYTGWKKYETLSDGVSILHQNYIIDTANKRLNVLPNKLEDNHNSDDYYNCSPALQRLIHIRHMSSASNEDIISILDFPKQTEYILKKTKNINYPEFYAWAPSSRKLLFSDDSQSFYMLVV